jgi:hypothetical protein
MKCAECRAPVRDAVKVFSSDDDGSHREFECLCRRCLEAEKAFARRVALIADGTVVKEFVNTKPLVKRPARAKVPAAA